VYFESQFLRFTALKQPKNFVKERNNKGRKPQDLSTIENRCYFEPRGTNR